MGTTSTTIREPLQAGLDRVPRCGCNGDGSLRVWAILMDVAEWLRGLGLERYAPAFRDNDVGEEVVRRLTAEDLRELGVTSIGHRRLLLEAIAALGDGEPAAEAKPAPVVPISSEAERRQLTVMFCDLVGSTALSTRLDPEDLREVIGAYHRAVSEIVAGFDGFVAKYMGDGVLIYFGYPRAHEDDAERAVRAGLGLIGAVGCLDVKSVKLQARVGIATGLVIVGDHQPGGDPDPRLELDGFDIEATDSTDQAQPGPDRPLGIVLMRSRVSEINQHAVAHVFRDETVEPGDDLGDSAMIRADDLAQILGIEPRRKRRRADQVAEHHGQLPAFGFA